MIQFVASCVCLLIATVAINANPVQSDAINFAAEARRIAHQSDWASVGPNSTINSKDSRVYIIKTVVPESSGDIFFYLPLVKVPPKTNDPQKIDLIYTDRKTGMGLMVLGTYQELEEGSELYKSGLEAYQSADSTTEPLAAGRLFKVDIGEIYVLRVGEDQRPVTLKEYYAGTDT